MTEPDTNSAPGCRGAQFARATRALERGRQRSLGHTTTRLGGAGARPPPVWNAGCAPLISAASNRSAILTGHGPNDYDLLHLSMR